MNIKIGHLLTYLKFFAKVEALVYLFNIYYNDHSHGTHKMKRVIETQWKLNRTHKIDNTVNT